MQLPLKDVSNLLFETQELQPFQLLAQVFGCNKQIDRWRPPCPILELRRSIGLQYEHTLRGQSRDN